MKKDDDNNNGQIGKTCVTHREWLAKSGKIDLPEDRGNPKPLLIFKSLI